ncbi:TPA: hypothetical protein ACGO7R_001066 [Streptococcus suis]
MLYQADLFHQVEQHLRLEGILQEFESKNGPIRGRMMIQEVAIPEELNFSFDPADQVKGYMASFDFYEMELGIAYSHTQKKPASGIWFRPQGEAAEEPSKEWIEFFINTLFENLTHETGIGMPMFSFVNDTSDFTLIPTVKNTKM